MMLKWQAVSENRIRFCTFTDVHGGSRCASLAVSRVVLCCFFRGVSLVMLYRVFISLVVFGFYGKQAIKKRLKVGILHMQEVLARTGNSDMILSNSEGDFSLLM